MGTSCSPNNTHSNNGRAHDSGSHGCCCGHHNWPGSSSHGLHWRCCHHGWFCGHQHLSWSLLFKWCSTKWRNWKCCHGCFPRSTCLTGSETWPPFPWGCWTLQEKSGDVWMDIFLANCSIYMILFISKLSCVLCYMLYFVMKESRLRLEYNFLSFYTFIWFGPSNSSLISTSSSIASWKTVAITQSWLPFFTTITLISTSFHR